MNRIYKTVIMLCCALLLIGCGGTQKKEAVYTSITAQEAKNLMDTEKSYVILDVRTKDEYDTGHIPNAVNISHDEVEARAENELPDKDALILVYCRSGNRSKTASQTLADMGYTNVKEFGGINSWPYDIEATASV